MRCLMDRWMSSLACLALCIAWCATPRAGEYSYEIQLCLPERCDERCARVIDQVRGALDDLVRTNPDVSLRLDDRKAGDFFPAAYGIMPPGIYLRVLDLRDGIAVRTRELNWGLPLADGEAVTRLLEELVDFSRMNIVAGELSPGIFLNHPDRPRRVGDIRLFPENRVEVYFFHSSDGAGSFPERVRLAQSALLTRFPERSESHTLVNLAVDLDDPANTELAFNGKAPRDTAFVVSVRMNTQEESVVFPMADFDDDAAFRDAVLDAVKREIAALEESEE